MKTRAVPVLVSLAVVSLPGRLPGQTTWDGGGGADTSWGTAANWDNDTLPAFDGGDSLSVTAGFGANAALTLGADRSIARITFGGGATPISLSGNTLALTSTTTGAAAGSALWNASTSDNKTATVDSGILLQAGVAGSYTGHFRENNNSGGGTRFNGAIAQGPGENWTLRFTRASARGQFFLNNAANSIAAIHLNGADVYSEVPGAFGGAALTLQGGVIGTRAAEHFAAPVSNSITLAGNSTWNSQTATRLTGDFAQGDNTLTFGTSSSPSGNHLTRLEYASLSGTGATTLAGAVVAPADMAKFAGGTLNLGNGTSGGSGVLVLSGGSGHGVPTWSDFTTARGYNESGGTDTWRINVNPGAAANVFNAGGFAARGADLLVPHQDAPGAGGISDTTFTRNFFLGSPATVDGVRYADHAVIVETNIAYGSLAAGDRRYFGAAWNTQNSKTSTSLALGGPVHELAGTISGENVTVYPMGHQNQPADGFALVRISNAANSLTGASRWILGGNRGNFTTVGGATVTGPGNMGDKATVGLIFTSDAAFGGAVEVMVSSQGSSGTYTNGTLLLEDANPAGSTSFARAVNLSNTTANATPAFGAYAGEVLYGGALAFAGSQGNLILHAGAGSTLTFAAGATLTNNNTAATTHNKTGAGTLAIDSLTVDGSQPTNHWNVRQGTMLVNTTLGGQVTVSGGATLGGSGTVAGNLTSGSSGATISPGNNLGRISVGGNLNCAAGATFRFELGSDATPGTTHDQIAVTGTFTGSTAAGGLKFDFTGLAGLSAGIAYDLIAFAAASGLTETDLAAVALPAGFALDPDFGTGGWLVDVDKLQVQFIAADGDPYQEWIAGAGGHFPGETDPSIAGKQADPDHDGVANLLEFALGSSPANGASRGLIFVKTAAVDGMPGVLTLTFAARNGATFAADGNNQKSVVAADSLTYLVEAANNLGDWGTPVVSEVTGGDAAAIQAGLGPAPGGWSYKTFRTDDAAATDPGDFIRLKVTSP